MKRRYDFLQQKDILKALNKVRNAFLAAKDGIEVDHVINGVLTFDERIKVGRRVLIAECLLNGMSMEQTKDLLRVGFTTIQHVANRLDKYEKCFELIKKRERKIEKEYRKKAYRLAGGSTKIFKRIEYTGFKRKDVGR